MTSNSIGIVPFSFRSPSGDDIIQGVGLVGHVTSFSFLFFYLLVVTFVALFLLFFFGGGGVGPSPWVLMAADDWR